MIDGVDGLDDIGPGDGFAERGGMGGEEGCAEEDAEDEDGGDGEDAGDGGAGFMACGGGGELGAVGIVEGGGDGGEVRSEGVLRGLELSGFLGVAFGEVEDFFGDGIHYLISCERTWLILRRP